MVKPDGQEMLKVTMPCFLGIIYGDKMQKSLQKTFNCVGYRGELLL